jgi:hypothetical protein
VKGGLRQRSGSHRGGWLVVAEDGAQGAAVRVVLKPAHSLRYKTRVRNRRFAGLSFGMQRKGRDISVTLNNPMDNPMSLGREDVP